MKLDDLRLPCEHGHLIQHDEWADGDFLVWEEMGMYEMKCGRVDCALEIVRPGKTQCRCDYDKTFPPGGPREPQMACPGGRVPTRQELIDILGIDYFAAADRLAFMLDLASSPLTRSLYQDDEGDPDEHTQRLAKSLVNAALGGGT